MGLELVRVTPEMTPVLGRIFYEAFSKFHAGHNVPGDLPNQDMATGALAMFTSRPDFYGVAAILDGQIVGSNFYSSTDAVAAVGPITVDPSLQANGIGRSLMQHVVDHARKHHGPQVRLVQDAVNTTSFSLYASIGFDAKEPLVLMDQKPANVPDDSVRPTGREDIDACDGLCQRVYRVSRRNELVAAIMHGKDMGMVPHVRERGGRIVASVVPGFFGFGVAESNEDLLSTVATAVRGAPPIVLRWLVPARNTELYRMALKSGARAVRMCNLMAMGPYEEPAGSWFPSIGH